MSVGSEMCFADVDRDYFYDHKRTTLLMRATKFLVKLHEAKEAWFLGQVEERSMYRAPQPIVARAREATTPRD